MQNLQRVRSNEKFEPEINEVQTTTRTFYNTKRKKLTCRFCLNMARKNTSHDCKTCRYYRQIKPRRKTPVLLTPSESESESELEVTEIFDNEQDIHPAPSSPEDNMNTNDVNEIESTDEQEASPNYNDSERTPKRAPAQGTSPRDERNSVMDHNRNWYDQTRERLNARSIPGRRVDKRYPPVDPSQPKPAVPRRLVQAGDIIRYQKGQIEN